MKKLLIIITASIATLTSCNDKKTYAAFGDTIEDTGAISITELTENYEHLKPGDTISVKFKGTIDEVCQKKGCWMTVSLDNGEETFVRFKDYGFFVPMNAGKSEAVVDGKAFVTETSIAELRHYAEDAGKSEEEIAQITEPKREFAFLASGVLIEEGKAE